MTITVMTVFKNQIFQSLIESLIYNIKYLLTNHNLQKHVFSKQNCHNCNCHNCHFVSNYSPFSLRFRKSLRYGFEKMRVVFLQLPLFEKKELECMDIFDCWIYVLNNMEQM